MAETTKIDWAQATWNPRMGCKMVGSGLAIVPPRYHSVLHSPQKVIEYLQVGG